MDYIDLCKTVSINLSSGKNISKLPKLYQKTEHLRNLLIGHLKLLLLDSEKLSWTAQNSYEHSNGFDKIVIAQDDISGCQLRLHIWWAKETTSFSDIHDHRWSFNSSILTGKLRTELYMPHASGKKFLRYRYIPQKKEYSSNKRYSLLQDGKANLIRTQVFDYTARSNYFMPHYSLHRVKSFPCITTATLVMHGNTINKQPIVFLQENNLNSQSFAVQQFECNTLSEKISELIKIIDYNL